MLVVVKFLPTDVVPAIEVHHQLHEAVSKIGIPPVSYRWFFRFDLNRTELSLSRNHPTSCGWSFSFELIKAVIEPSTDLKSVVSANSLGRN